MPHDSGHNNVSLIFENYFMIIFLLLFRNLFEWENPFVSFCGLIIIPAIIWHFDIWMVPAFLILLLTYQLLKPRANTEAQELEENKEPNSQVSFVILVVMRALKMNRTRGISQ